MTKIALIEIDPHLRIEIANMLDANIKDINLFQAENLDSFLQSYPELAPGLIILGFADVTSSEKLERLF